MKIGSWNIGLVKNSEPAIKTVPKPKAKAFDTILGGILDFGKQRLSSDKTISSKLLEANVGWVYRNNDVIAKEVSNIEFELYTVGLKGGEITYTEITSHPLLDLLDKFNSSTTSSDGIYITQSHKKLTGDAFWLLQRSTKGLPDSIYILPPDKIELKLGNPTDSTTDLIEGYVYKDVINGEQIDITYQPEEIIHFKTPNPNNPFRGLGAVEAAADTIDIDNLTNQANRNFFENGAIINFILGTEAKITDDQMKRLKAEIRSVNTGVNNAWKPMILGGGLEPKSVSLSNKDQEFLAQLEWYRDKIMNLFGNTKASLGIIDDVNRASHENSILGWKRGTIKPEMEAIVNTLNEFLVPLFGDYLVLGFCDPVPEDRAAKLEEIKTLLQSKEAVITVNEAREMMDFDPIPGQDELPEKVLPVVQPPIAPPKSLQNINLKHVLRTRGIYDLQARNKELKEAARPLAEKLVKSRSKKTAQHHTQFTNEQVWGYWEKQIHVVEMFEKRFHDKVEQFIGKIEKSVLEHLDNEIISMKGKQLYDDEDFLVQAEIDFTPLLMEEIIIAGQQAYSLVGMDTPYIPLNVRENVSENVMKFASSMLETDRNSLIDIIVNGIKDGRSVPEMRSEIQSKFQDIKKYQAERITRTEVLRTSNMGALDAYKQSGVVEGKQWLTAGAVDECAQYEGKIVGLDGNFYSDGNEFQDGDPPLHPNCRCVILPVLAEQKAFQPTTILEREILESKIKELEAKIDKRTKQYRDIKDKQLDDAGYILSLEQLLGVADVQPPRTPENS